MTDNEVHNSSPVEKPPLSPELNLSRSFRRNFKHKNKKTIKKNQLDQDNKNENAVLNDCLDNLEYSVTPTKALNELDTLLQIEQDRKSLYDRLSTSKEGPSFIENCSVWQHKAFQNDISKNLDGQSSNKSIFCPIKATEQLEFAKLDTPLNKMKSIAIVNSHLERAKVSADSTQNYESVIKVISINNINVKDTKLVKKDIACKINNIFKSENFDDLKLNNELGSFSKASDTIINKSGAELTKIKSNSSDLQINEVDLCKDNKIAKLKIDNTIHNQKIVGPAIDNKSHCSKTATHSTNVSQYTQHNKVAEKSLNFNIFNDENFSDLNISNNNLAGFQKASFAIKNAKKKNPPNEPRIFTSNIVTPNVVNMDISGFEKIEKGENLTNKYISGINKSERVAETSLQVISSNVKSYLGNIFKDEDFSDLKQNGNGLQQASVRIQDDNFKKSYEISNQTASESQFNNTKDFKNIFKDENFVDLDISNSKFGGFQRASSSKQTFNNMNIEKNLQMSGCIKKNDHFTPNKFGVNKVNVADIFKDIDLSDITPIRDAFNTSRPVGTLRKFPNSSGKLSKSRSFYKSEDFTNLSLKKCENSIFKRTPISPVCENVVWEPNFQEVKEFKGFTHSDQTLSLRLERQFCQHVGVSDEYILNFKSKRKLSYTELEQDTESPTNKKFKHHENQSFLRKPKKRLGTHFKPSITMSTNDLERAKGFFKEELSVCPLQTSTPIRSHFGSSSYITSSVTPIKFNNLTPIKEEKSYLSNVSTKLFFADESSNVSLADKTTVPKQFGLNKPTEGTVNNWLENLDSERRLLEKRLRIVCERQNILEGQGQIMSKRHSVRAEAGVLYVSKTQTDRYSLRSIGKPGSTFGGYSGNKFLNMINPQNAMLVHFGVNKGNTCIKTSDCAEIVPNFKEQIGVSEIEHSFSVMQSVDRKLIPEGWVRNHYRWIVWKLASYERAYPEKFEGVFCLDNVVQQLKYRYDREIDKAERPALVKIFEKDDCSQKRLVLCVSNIKKVNKEYELDLTDGWYSIRTIIDKPLSNQIATGKLKIGTKIVTCGAEMLNNSDGCSPLEASSNICLKITFNSSRRAAWWSKLGYQKDPSAIRIPLSSVDLEGGRIGCITFYVARVYPIKYLEKLKENNVWRNYKAEERKAQLWESKQHSRLEKLMNNVNQTIEESQSDSPVIFDNIESIEDPEDLHKILKKSKDPEKINEILSSSQRASLLSYQVMISSKNHSKLLTKICKTTGNTEKRNVTPLLRIRILDASGDSETDYNFYVWSPKEYHLTLLKEGDIISAFNVACSTTWGLTTNKSTKFRKEQNLEPNKFERIVRKIIRIDDLSKDAQRLVFQEFDTVGIVVKINIGQSQELWLSSISNRLLLIKIYDSAENVLLLDGFKDGDVVIVCNIIFKEIKDEYVCSAADYYSCISKYSKVRHLQEESWNISAELQKMDLSVFLKTARGKINKIERIPGVQVRSSVWSPDDGMDCSQLTTTDMALLECINKLDS